jgi:hypothetical protein
MYSLASYTPVIKTSTARMIKSLWSAILPVRRKLDRRTAAMSLVARIRRRPIISKFRIKVSHCRVAGQKRNDDDRGIGREQVAFGHYHKILLYSGASKRVRESMWLHQAL